MLTSQIRNILAVPETFRAMPQKKKRKKRFRPEIPETLLQRKAQFEEAGITSEIRWDKLSRDYYLAYKNSGSVPDWN